MPLGASRRASATFFNAGSDKANIVGARMFDRFEKDGQLSLAIEVTLQPVDKSYDVAALNAILGTDLKPELLPPRAGDVRDSLASLDLIGRELGYEPSVDFAEGLRRAAASIVEAG